MDQSQLEWAGFSCWSVFFCVFLRPEGVVCAVTECWTDRVTKVAEKGYSRTFSFITCFNYSAKTQKGEFAPNFYVTFPPA